MKKMIENSREKKMNERANEKTTCSAPEASIPTKLQQQPHKLAIKPLPGFTHNPLLKLPRNRKCPCLSGKKFKACHLPLLPRVVSQDDAEKFSKQMRQDDLVFITKENEALIKDANARLSGDTASQGVESKL
jgi:hypothetical protein